MRDAERERAARAALADHGADDRHRQARHDLEVLRDRLGLAALLGVDARVGALRVDEADDRTARLRAASSIRRSALR